MTSGGFSTDMIGANYSYPDGDYAQRAAIIKQQEFYTKFLFWFIGNDARMPETLRKEVRKYSIGNIQKMNMRTTIILARSLMYA